MRPIRLPEPPSASPAAVPEIFESGVFTSIRRAVIIGNGFPGSENQSIGLLRALGFPENNQFLYRVTRPRGGINEWLHWLPVSLHKKLFFFLRHISGYSQLLLKSQGETSLVSTIGGKAGISSVLEADVKQIVTMARQTYEKDGPLLVVASGRDTISSASSIRRLASDSVYVVQIYELVNIRTQTGGVKISATTHLGYKPKIQHPRYQLNRFDLVITPRHDYYPLTPQAQEQVPRFIRKWITPREPPEKHVVLTLGALHQIDSAVIRGAAAAWHDEFAPLQRPILVVNIGGPTRNCGYGVDLAKKLIVYLQSVLASCGTIRISFSVRTPQKISSIILKELGNNPKVYIWDGAEPNPHMGHLAWADAFVVTADSVSMISEACSTGKPVYAMGVEHCKWKLSDFHNSLKDRGMVRPFTGSEDMSESWSYPPLNDSAEAAIRVHEALAVRGWRIRA